MNELGTDNMDNYNNKKIEGIMIEMEEIHKKISKILPVQYESNQKNNDIYFMADKLSVLFFKLKNELEDKIVLWYYDRNRYNKKE